MSGARVDSSLLLSGQVDGLLWQVEAILMVWHYVNQAMSKLGLLQTKHALVDLLLQKLTSVFIVHEFAHSRCHQSLVVELFVLSFASSLTAFLAILLATAGAAWMFLGIFGLSRIGLVVVEGIAHELLFDVLHSLVDLRCSAFFLDSDSIRREIDFLFSTSLSVEMSLLWEVLFAEVVLWAAGQAACRHGLLLKNSECTLRSVVRRKQRIACLPDTNIVDNLLGFCCHLVRRVLDDLSQSQNNGYHINRNTHWHVGLVPRRRVAAQLILLMSNE